MIPQIRPAQLAAWLASVQGHGKPVLLDVREPNEVAVASIAGVAGVGSDTPDNGYELVAMPMGNVPARLSELDASRPIACLCHHGARSQRVAQFLQAQGFSHVINIAGGIDAWAQELDGRVARY